jgi:hypothetical protein
MIPSRMKVTIGIPVFNCETWVATAIQSALDLSILLCVALKNVLSYSYSLLFQWVNASISHRLHCGILHQLLSVGQSYLDAHDSGKLLNTLEHGHLACQFRVLDHG